eukprot:PhF_6_TR40729/c0_g1_i3/m.61273
MDSLYHGCTNQCVLRVITCLVLHENILVLPMDVVHTMFDLYYSWVWKFAPHWQCDPSMPDHLSIGGEHYYKEEDPDMLIDPTGTTSWHVDTHVANSIVLMTPSFTMEDVLSDRVRPCRLRFPQDRSGCSHFIFVYREGCQFTTALHYDPFTNDDELVTDVQFTSQGIQFDFEHHPSSDWDTFFPTYACWNEIKEYEATHCNDRLWLG